MAIMSSITPALQLEDIHLSFAGVKALRGIDLSVNAGSLNAIIGPNGAGKTSLFNCVSGSYRPQRGRILLFGMDIMHAQPDDIARRA